MENGNQLFCVSIENKLKEYGLEQSNDKFKLLRLIVEFFSELFKAEQIL